MNGENRNNQFEFGGINHLALVCRDMQRTVDILVAPATATQA